MLLAHLAVRISALKANIWCTNNGVMYIHTCKTYCSQCTYIIIVIIIIIWPLTSDPCVIIYYAKSTAVVAARSRSRKETRVIYSETDINIRAINLTNIIFGPGRSDDSFWTGPPAWKRLANNCLTKKTLSALHGDKALRRRFLQDHLLIAIHLIAFAHTWSVSVYSFPGPQDVL